VPQYETAPELVVFLRFQVDCSIQLEVGHAEKILQFPGCTNDLAICTLQKGSLVRLPRKAAMIEYEYRFTESEQDKSQNSAASKAHSDGLEQDRQGPAQGPAQGPSSASTASKQTPRIPSDGTLRALKRHVAPCSRGVPRRRMH
jgi:hypothetical protein